MNGRGPDAAMAQVMHLVLHQRNERCDDDAHPFLSERRHLEGDALASTGRHQSQGVMPVAYRLDDVSLDAAKRIVAPIALQDA